MPSTITVPAGKTIQVPISGDASSALDYGADPTAGLTASFHGSTDPWLELDTSRGVLRFQLFSDLAPNTVRKIRGLVDSGFYDGLTFHRVVNDDGFRIAQGGSPTGDNAGKPGFTFDDEFNPSAIFDYTGQLAMASTGKDGNGSQFFITGATARSLDFNQTIFGQMTRGSKVLESILGTANPDVDPALGTPTSTTTIRSARIITGVDDAVMQLKASSRTGTRSVVVTAVDDDGNEVTQTIRVKVVAETQNTPPILVPPASPITAQAGQKIAIPIDAIDLEGENYNIGANILSGGEGVDLSASSLDQTTHVATFQIRPGFSGAIQVTIGVKGDHAVYRGSIAIQPGEDTNSLRIFDTQVITISVGGTPIQQADSVGTIGARVGEAIDGSTVLATFDSDASAAASDFTATVDWGDGAALTSATIQRVGAGTFAVLAGGHRYAQAADALPVTIAISGKNGTRQTLDATAVVGDPAALDGDGTLTIRGTEAADDVDLSTDGGTLSVRVQTVGGDDQTTTYALSKVKRIVVALFGSDDQLTTLNADGLPAMSVDAGDGDDTIYGGDGDDSISGGDGDDALYGNAGDDTIHGGAGDDLILAGSGKNTVYAEDGDDRVIGGNGRDYINGGDGNDRLYGRGGNDTIEGGGGTDRLYGEDGDDLLIGGSSNDRIYGEDGNDTLYGNAGNDGLYGGPGTNHRGDAIGDDTVTELDA